MAVRAATASAVAIPSGNIMGVTNGSNALAGVVGEYQQAFIIAPPGVALPTGGVATDAVSLPLTAGDWDVRGQAYFSSSVDPTGVAFVSGWLSSVSAAIPSPITDSSFTQQSLANLALTGSILFMVGPKRFSLAAPGTVFLSGRANYTGGSMLIAGLIAARRVR